jgi:nucleoid-associated protein YgaU
MTATLSSSSNVDRTTPRPVGRPSTWVSADRDDHVDDNVDYGLRRAAAAVIVVLVVAVVAIAVSALAGAMAGVGGRPAAASVAASAPASSTVRIHVAQPGDTLWSIADRYRGEVGQGRFVDALIDLNGGTVIQIGQAIRLP